MTDNGHREQLRLPVESRHVDAVDAVRSWPTTPCGLGALVVPGAGGTLDTPAVVALAEALVANGVVVVRANLPYRQTGRRPPRAESTVDDFVSVAHAARAACQAAGDHISNGWLVAGRSYGGRVASLAVTDPTTVRDLDVVGLVVSGYPLHPPGKPDRLRVAHWPQVGVDCLFLQGDRDPFADIALLRALLPQFGASVQLHEIAGGDHSLRVTRAASPDGTARSDAASMAACVPVIGEWLQQLERGGQTRSQDA